MSKSDAKYRKILNFHEYEEFKKIEIVSAFKEDEYLLYARRHQTESRDVSMRRSSMRRQSKLDTSRASK